MSVRPAKTQTSLGIRPVWSKCSLCAQWVAKDPRFLHADSEDSDQTGRMSRLIWVFAGRTLILFVLSCRGSYSQHSKLKVIDHYYKSHRKDIWNETKLASPFSKTVTLSFFKNVFDQLYRVVTKAWLKKNRKVNIGLKENCRLVWASDCPCVVSKFRYSRR